jgi:hypothetical protein
VIVTVTDRRDAMRDETWIVVSTTDNTPNLLVGPFADTMAAMQFEANVPYECMSFHNSLEEALVERAAGNKWKFEKAAS